MICSLILFSDFSVSLYEYMGKDIVLNSQVLTSQIKNSTWNKLFKYEIFSKFYIKINLVNLKKKMFLKLSKVFFFVCMGSEHFNLIVTFILELLLINCNRFSNSLIYDTWYRFYSIVPQFFLCLNLLCAEEGKIGDKLLYSINITILRSYVLIFLRLVAFYRI